jgi:hypothetical protein
MSNRLATEPSPYLLQHADNPVDWYPWGEEALEKARREDKPILLSIGYSACHWCHVMAHDCFEDEEVAAAMNRLFVNIKVDREERPDLDQIYQAAHQLLAGRGGGWPLTVFLAPDQTPFFAGTYFPKTPRYNLPGFVDLMENVARAWRERRGEVLAQNVAVREALAEQQPAAGREVPLTAAPLAQGVRDLARAFDPVWGGFSRAPKFPRPGELFFLLRQAQAGNGQARDMALFTLRKMASGGVVDQLGGGFCRYSVDEQWAIPHFEKMLYDNGPLLHLYADAWALTGEPLFRETAEGIVGWLLREMRAPDGGFYSALDADSEGREGNYYVWARDEARALLSAEEWAVAAPVFGFDAPPNFENAHWNPILAQPLAEVAATLGIPETEAARCLASARTKLFAAREARVRPGCDDKQLTGWNALMIAGLAHAGRVMQRPDWVDAAHAALDFLRTPRSISCARRARFPAHAPVARRPPAGELEARRGAAQRLSRRLRLPARCPAGNAAGRLPRAGSCLGARTRRRPAGAFRGRGGRRLLLHQPRSRGADHASQARLRQRHAVGQRRRRVRAAAARSPARRSALSRGGRALPATVPCAPRRAARRLSDPPRRPRRGAGAAPRDRAQGAVRRARRMERGAGAATRRRRHAADATQRPRPAASPDETGI